MIIFAQIVAQISDETKMGKRKIMTKIDGYTTPNMPVKKNGEWLIISFKDGEYAKYKPDEYTDYYYDKVCFVVIRDKQWIGIYNIDEIKWIEVVTDESNIS